MDVLVINDSPDFIGKPETEQVQQEKTEYCLLGTFLRSRGLKLFGYNHLNDFVFEVYINYGDTIHLFNFNGILVPVDLEAEKCSVDNRFQYFEALNMKNAERRVNNFKKGKLKELCNLRKPDMGNLKFW